MALTGIGALVVNLGGAFHLAKVREDQQAPRARFEFELQDHLTQSDADSTLRAVIGWGRYAELFSYDDPTRTFALGHHQQ